MKLDNIVMIDWCWNVLVLSINSLSYTSPPLRRVFWRLCHCIQMYNGLLTWRRHWHPTPVLLPGKSHGRRSLVGCSPWGCKESDTTEWLRFHFSFSCTGEGDGNPLQCSCLENLRDGGAWWAAVYGVTQSRTWLKWLGSSSSKELLINSVCHLWRSVYLDMPFFDWVACVFVVVWTDYIFGKLSPCCSHHLQILSFIL